jgi:hypothetical protein
MVHQAIRNKRQGKAVQKKVVESFGGVNIGTLGGEDGWHPIWSIEVKSCARFTGLKYMEQCEKNCKTGKTPLLIVHTTNMRHPEDLVIMRRRDWDDWFGKIRSDQCSKPSQSQISKAIPKRRLISRRESTS